MEIKRDYYFQQLIERKDNNMIKVITGIRRCGKSFLLFNIFKNYLIQSGILQNHIIEISLDGIENEELRDPKTCYTYIKNSLIDDSKYYLLLDEVQFMPRFEEVLNSLLKIKNIDVYVTGSNSKFLSSDIVTEFRGRGDEIGVLVDVLASSIGSNTNPTKISNTFTSERKISYTNKTISQHINYLEDSFLISKAFRYDIKGRKHIGANLKYYFTDIGLRNARLNFRQQKYPHIIENIVYNELLIRGYNVDVGIVDIYTAQMKMEIDNENN